MQQQRIEDNPILKLSVELALMIVAYCEELEQQRKYVISRQLLKSGTSIGANSFEAQNAESKADFIHKMKIAAKEADETAYWLLLCAHAPQYPAPENVVSKLDEISRILNKILFTAKRRNPFSYLLSLFLQVTGISKSAY